MIPIRTDRLLLGDWHQLSGEHGLDLVEVVRQLLTPATTAAMSAGDLGGEYDRMRAEQWISDRDAEAVMCLVLLQSSDTPIGLLQLEQGPAASDPDRLSIHLGWLLAEPYWGQGLDAELIGGVVHWARHDADIVALSAGVDPEDTGAARALTNNGFAPGERRDGVQHYRRPAD